MEKQYSLIKEGDGEFAYKDQDGVCWDTPTRWLFTGILGGCGCGSADDFGDKAFRLLAHFNSEPSQRDWAIFDENGGFFELMAHWFDDKDLIEHGSSISGSWLSAKGKHVYKTVEQLKQSSL